MKSIKKELIQYLERNGRDKSLVELYDEFPFAGTQITNKQKGDRIRSVERKLKRKSSKQKQNNNAKILVFDTETSPLLSYVWSLWKQNVNPMNGQLMGEKMILSWSAKWLYEDKVINDSMTPLEIELEDDYRVTRSLWQMMNEADIVIAHNAKGFDVKIFNQRCLKHGLPPTTHYQVIDTLLHARKRFRLESNKLDYLGKFLKLGSKQDTGGFSLWADCMKGSIDAMKRMVSYCDQDVKLLEAVYLKMRPWIMPHPNVNLIVEDTSHKCPTCASQNIQDYDTYTTYANIYNAFKCNDCHSTFRTRSATRLDKSLFNISTPD